MNRPRVRGRYINKNLPTVAQVRDKWGNVLTGATPEKMYKLLARIKRMRRMRDKGHDVDTERLDQLEAKYRRYAGVGHTDGFKGHVKALKERRRQLSRKLARVDAELMFLEYETTQQLEEVPDGRTGTESGTDNVDG